MLITESWNGSSWTEVNDLNTARQEVGWSWNTNSSNCIGGSMSPTTIVANVETWDGSSWTEVADLPTVDIIWQAQELQLQHSM